MGKPQADENRRRKAGVVGPAGGKARSLRGRERERVEEAARLVIERRRDVLEELARR